MCKVAPQRDILDPATNVSKNPLLFIKVKMLNSVHSFLIDTGSAVSILPSHTFFHPSYVLSPATHVTLHDSQGHTIPSKGVLTIPFSIPILRRSYSWPFLFAEVTTPILGADFLSANHLIVDMSCKSM